MVSNKYDPIYWRGVFARWLRAHPVLDRIDYADVPRFVGQNGFYDMSGPVVRLERKDVR